MNRKKNNPLSQGLKAAKNVDVVDDPKKEVSQSLVKESTSTPPGVDSRERKKQVSGENKSQKRGRGRPPGKKSDPKMTQAGGYVDEDLYLDIQITLTQLKRRFTKRSEVNVSTLMGALFNYFQGLSKNEQETFLRQYSDIDQDEL